MEKIVKSLNHFVILAIMKEIPC